MRIQPWIHVAYRMRGWKCEAKRIRGRLAQHPHHEYLEIQSDKARRFDDIKEHVYHQYRELHVWFNELKPQYYFGVSLASHLCTFANLLHVPLEIQIVVSVGSNSCAFAHRYLATRGAETLCHHKIFIINRGSCTFDPMNWSFSSIFPRVWHPIYALLRIYCMFVLLFRLLATVPLKCGKHEGNFV